MNKIISKIHKEMKANIDPVYKEGAQRFFKENVEVVGVRAPIIRKISRKYFASVKNLSKKDIFALCHELLELNYHEIAFGWAHRIEKQYTKSDFKIFEKWLKKYVSSWASCDDFCTHAFGLFIFKFPEFIPKVKSWTKSKNRWFRRASAVVLIYSVRRKKYLEHIFKISDILLQDADDVVQKGYGWTLKEASNLYPKKIFNYVMKNKKKMPRTALRYAIEKLPLKMKTQAMRK